MKQNQRIAILGGGEKRCRYGYLAKKEGWEVFLSDRGKLQEHYREVLIREDIAFEAGQHTEELILSADCIMKSPGIPEKAPIVKKALEKGIPVISEIEFASAYTHHTLIGITGSNGKTTTTLLT